jgi:hypothetical protein
MDPDRQKKDAFYKSLTPREMEAHKLAAQMLGSSYIVDKTHAFVKWEKKVNASQGQVSDQTKATPNAAS